MMYPWFLVAVAVFALLLVVLVVWLDAKYDKPEQKIFGILHTGGCTCHCRVCRKGVHCSNIGSHCRTRHQQHRTYR